MTAARVPLPNMPSTTTTGMTLNWEETVLSAF